MKTKSIKIVWKVKQTRKKIDNSTELSAAFTSVLRQAIVKLNGDYELVCTTDGIYYAKKDTPLVYRCCAR